MPNELRLAFFVEHDLSFLTANHSSVFKSTFTDSAMVRNVTYKQTETAYLINHDLTLCINKMVQDLN